MAYLIQPEYVTYSCTCGKLKPITQIYFCRHCLKIRCGFCICHEVDSHYCANCLENMPSSEARLKKNKCSSCFDCPSCFHTLSTRATTVRPTTVTSTTGSGDGTPPPTTTNDGKVPPKKMYYLSCFNCRWTSRDVGLPDQTVASGGWPEYKNVNAERVNILLEYYKSLALQEKQEKLERERKKYSLRSKYITLTDKIGLTSAMARGVAGMCINEPTGSTNVMKPPAVSTHTVINDLPDDIYTKPVNLMKVTSMEQRLGAVAWQPTSVGSLHPIPRQLAVKRSQRCKECDHNLTKPEFNPGSIKFKIELLAYFHVPELRLVSWKNMDNDQIELLVRLTNPTAYDMNLQLLEDQRPDKLTKECIETSLTWKGIELMLPARNDADEYDEAANTRPDSDFIVWRKANKAIVKLNLNLGPTESDDKNKPIYVFVCIEYSYKGSAVKAHTQLKLMK